MSPTLILSGTQPSVTPTPQDLVPCHGLFRHLPVCTHILTQSFTDINTQCIKPLQKLYVIDS